MERQEIKGQHIMRHHSRRRARHNPDMTLAREAGATLASTVVGAAGALGLEKLLSGMKKGGSGADKDTAKYSHKQTAVMLGVGGAALGVLLHVKGIAPRIGKALAAGSVALAGARWVDHKDETYTAARATPGSRGAYGYLPVPFLLSPRNTNQSQEIVRPRFPGITMNSTPSYVVPEAQFMKRSGEAIGVDYGTVYNGG